MEQEQIKHVLDTVPQDRAAALAKAMMRYGVTDGDPVIEIVRLAIDTDASRAAAAQAAETAGEAATQIVASIGQIEDRVLKGAAAAGRDTAGVIRIEASQVTEMLKAAVAEAAKSAAARLAKAAAAQGPAIVDEWKRELARAAWDFARRSQWRNLASLLALIAIGALSGAAIALYVVKVGL